jgi:hypothetical protein
MHLRGQRPSHGASFAERRSVAYLSVMALVPCSSCHRHVRSDEAACPFCGGAPSIGPTPRSPGARLSRSAAFAFASALSVAACGGEVAKPTDAGADTRADGDVDDGGNVALYGAPAPEDVGPEPTDVGPGPDDDGGPRPLYGGAPPP